MRATERPGIHGLALTQCVPAHQTYDWNVGGLEGDYGACVEGGEVIGRDGGGVGSSRRMPAV